MSYYIYNTKSQTQKRLEMNSFTDEIVEFKKRKENKKSYSDTRKFYSSKEWKELREQFLNSMSPCTTLGYHKCKYCSRIFQSKWHLTRHYSRKKSCVFVKTDAIRNIQEHITQKQSKISPGQAHYKPIVSPEQAPCKPNISPEQNQLKCNICNKIFKRKNNLYRHKNLLRCSKMKDIDKLNKVVNLNNKVVNKIANFNKIIKNNDKNSKKIVIFDEKSIKKINKSTIDNSINNSNINSNNTTNNHIDTNNSNNSINNNNTINNNITINAFGNENLDSITDKKKVSILNTYFCSFKNALKTIHYDIPENCNFFLSNKRDRKFMQVFNGKNCIYEDSYKFKDKLSNNIMNKLEEWFELHEEKFKTRKKVLLTRMFNEFNEGKLEDRYHNEIELFTLNYSSDIKELLNKEIKKLK